MKHEQFQDATKVKHGHFQYAAKVEREQIQDSFDFLKRRGEWWSLSPLTRFHLLGGVAFPPLPLWTVLLWVVLLSHSHLVWSCFLLLGVAAVPTRHLLVGGAFPSSLWWWCHPRPLQEWCF